MQRLICVARMDRPVALALVQEKLGGAGIWSSVDMFHMANNHSHCAIAFGGAKAEVLEKDAQEAVDLLADGAGFVSTGLRGWRMLLMIFVLFQTAAGPSPSAVYLQRVVQRAQTEQTS